MKLLVFATILTFVSNVMACQPKYLQLEDTSLRVNIDKVSYTDNFSYDNESTRRNPDFHITTALSRKFTVNFDKNYGAQTKLLSVIDDSEENKGITITTEKPQKRQLSLVNQENLNFGSYYYYDEKECQFYQYKK